MVCLHIDSTDLNALICKTPDTGPSSALRPSHLDSGSAVISTRMSPGDRSPLRPSARGLTCSGDGCDGRASDTDSALRCRYVILVILDLRGIRKEEGV
jgi:hypothetical protein